MSTATLGRPEGLGRHVDHVMGMPISLALRGRHADDRIGRAAWAEAMAALRDVDRVFSTYRPGSFISRLSRGEISLADCPPEVAEVLALGARAAQESGGAFRLRLPGPDGKRRLDPSGVVKGWAVERAAQPLRLLEDTDFSLSAGGDLVCRTLDEASGPWQVGIEDPHHPDRLIAVVPVRTGAVATSGTAHRGAHLVDGRTGQPPVGIASVTVIAASLTHADIDATAAYALGVDAAHWLEARPGRTALVVWADGTTTSTRCPWPPVADGPGCAQESLRTESITSASVFSPAQPRVTVRTFWRAASSSVLSDSTAASPRFMAIRSSIAAFTVLPDRPKIPSELIARSRTP